MKMLKGAVILQNDGLLDVEALERYVVENLGGVVGEEYKGAVPNITFTGAGACPKDETCPIHDYTDAGATEWYHDGVHYCIEKGLMIGLPGNLLAPSGITTRAQLVTLLWRLEGEPVADYEMTFEDVADGLWYTEAIRWASFNQVVEGYSDTLFGPNDTITREQMVTLLWRYCKYKGYDVSVGEDTNILSFEDAFDVSSWAKEAMQWACGAGMVEGMQNSDGNMVLNPKGNTTRAQLAAVLMRVDYLRPAQSAQEDGQRFDLLGAHFAGQWVNELSSRCVLQIIGNGVGPFKVTVRWSSSAYAFSQWEMTAVHEITETGDSRLVAQDCVRYDVTYLSETEFEYEAVEVGTMQLDYSNNGKESILWAYELDVADECTFVRENDQVLNPIESILKMETSNESR